MGAAICPALPTVLSARLNLARRQLCGLLSPSRLVALDPDLLLEPDDGFVTRK